MADNEVFTLSFPEYNLLDSRTFDNAKLNTTSNLLVYPNPTKDEVLIKMDKLHIKNVKIFNQNGMLQKDIHIEEYEVNLSFGDLPEGIYYLHILDELEVWHIEKVVIIR